MSCNDKHHHDPNCVSEVVNFIDEIQKAHHDFTGCSTNCLNPILGATHHHGMKPNTRVFSLYTKTGELFKAEFLNEGCERRKSEFFRVESVEGPCAVVRILKLDDGNLGMCDFDKTSQCIVVDLNCFCAIACIQDTFIPGV